MSFRVELYMALGAVCKFQACGLDVVGFLPDPALALGLNFC